MHVGSGIPCRCTQAQESQRHFSCNATRATLSAIKRQGAVDGVRTGNQTPSSWSPAGRSCCCGTTGSGSQLSALPCQQCILSHKAMPVDSQAAERSGADEAWQTSCANDFTVLLQRYPLQFASAPRLTVAAVDAFLQSRDPSDAAFVVTGLISSTPRCGPPASGRCRTCRLNPACESDPGSPASFSQTKGRSRWRSIRRSCGSGRRATQQRRIISMSCSRCARGACYATSDFLPARRAASTR